MRKAVKKEYQIKLFKRTIILIIFIIITLINIVDLIGLLYQKIYGLDYINKSIEMYRKEGF